MGEMEGMGTREQRGPLERRGSKGRSEILVLGDRMGSKECKETQAQLDIKDQQGSEVYQEEGPPTFAGVGQPAPLARGLS